MYLWLQQELQGTELTLHKVHGLANPADFVTKHLNQQSASKHLELLDMWTEGGRADTAPRLDSINAAEVDEWNHRPIHGPLASLQIEQVGITRTHRKARRALFTPIKVPGAPPAAELTPTRITIGKFIDNDEEFCYIECWTRRDGKAHMDLERRWTGSTTFIKRSKEWPLDQHD